VTIEHRMTFVVRIVVDEARGVTGIVERVRTGKKERVRGLEEVGRIVARMVQEAMARRPPPPRR
jgi:hypothetical protein